MARLSLLIIIVFGTVSFLPGTFTNNWGYFSHKMINRLAIFTLPPEVGAVFKVNLDRVEDFAVAPDNRRHSSPYEAERHYIDIDHWGNYPFDNVPRTHRDAVWEFGNILLLDKELSDTLDLRSFGTKPSFEWLRDSLMSYYYQNIRYQEESNQRMDLPSRKAIFIDEIEEFEHFDVLIFEDRLADYGILPYHLIQNQNQLSRAFSSLDLDRIIRYASEMGHYISDAHVPLHTTENYNGQLTDQLGIHAFWESRIPELFAEENFNFWIGSAEYIRDKQSFYWNIILDSHSLVNDVLMIEKTLSETFPTDQQYCFDERLGRTQRIECREYAKAYQNMMSGMVERQMQKSIKAIGSAWYTAWVDAGSPKMDAKHVKFQIDSTNLDAFNIEGNTLGHKSRNEK